MFPRDNDDNWRAAAQEVGIAAGALMHTSMLELAAHRLTVARRNREAEAVYREILRREPTHRNALRNLMSVLGVQGRRAEVQELYRRLVEAEVADLDLPADERAGVVAFRLAEAGIVPCPDRAPAVEVARRFDAYAEEYDAHLVDVLGYRGPEVLAGALANVLGPALGNLDVLDLGCGTGLVGPWLRPFARRLDGVDLAPGMLEKARARGIYDRLDVADVTRLPNDRTREYDLAVAVDVLIYLGALAPVFRSVASVLRPGGMFAFTVEAGTAPGFVLNGNGRFAHDPEYLRTQAALEGFELVALDEAVIRREQRQDVASLVTVTRRNG